MNNGNSISKRPLVSNQNSTKKARHDLSPVIDNGNFFDSVIPRESVTVCTFAEGDLVWVKELDNKGWTLGIVAHIRMPFELGSSTYKYGIGVEIENEDGSKRIPKTWKNTIDDIPCNFVQKCLRHVDKNLLKLTGIIQRNIYRNYRQISGLKFDKDKSNPSNEFDDSDIYDIQAVLGENEDIHSWIDKIKTDKRALKVVELATNEKHTKLNDMYALAYIVGKFMGVELQSSEQNI